MRAGAVLAAGTAASRVLGFVRAVVLLTAVSPGTEDHPSLSADAFGVANTIPNALYLLLAGGVLNAVLVPQIARAARGLDGGREYVDRLLTLCVAGLLVIATVVTAAAPLLIRLYGSDEWPPEQVALATAFALWCLPQVFWYGLYTLLGQVLNARGVFGPYTWAPVVNNVVAIAGMLAFIAVTGGGSQPVSSWSAGRIALLAGTSTLGVVAQALVLVPSLRRAGIGWRIRWGMRGSGLGSAGRVAGWTLAALAVQQLGFVVISRVTTTAGARAFGTDATVATGKAVYDQALLLFMLPHSLVAVSLVTALFTRISRSAADDRVPDVVADLSLGLRLTGLATVPAAAAFLALGPDLCAAAFVGNERAVTDGIAYAAMAMMLGLVPFSAQYLIQRVFYAFEDARTPFLVQVPVVALWATGNLVSLAVLPPAWVVVGVGASMALANTVGVLVALVPLRRLLGHLDGAHVLRTHGALVLAAGAGGLVAWGVSRAVHAGLGDGRPATALAAVLGGSALVAVYVLLLRLIRLPELGEVPASLRRRA